MGRRNVDTLIEVDLKTNGGGFLTEHNPEARKRSRPSSIVSMLSRP